MREQTRDTLPQPCPQWAEKLSALQLHDLSSPEKEETERHITMCLACSSVLKQYHQMDVLLKGLPAVLPREQLPVHLLAQTKREYIGMDMKKHTITEQETGMFVIPSNKSQPKGTMRRFLQVMSTLAAVLVVAAIATSAFLLFSHRNPVSSTGDVPTSTQNAVYYNPEIPGNAGRANIYAFNPNNGSVIWRTHLQTKLNTSLMTQYQGKVFAPGYDGTMYALDASSGRVLWTYSIKNDPVYPGVPQNSNSPSSAIAAGNTIFFGAPSGAYAVDIDSGKLIWHKKPLPTCKGAQVTQSGTVTIVNGSPTCNIVPIAATKDTAFTYIDGLYALKASTGAVLWSDKNRQFTGYNSLAAVSGKVYIVDTHSQANSCESKLSVLQESSGQVIKTFDHLGCDSSIALSSSPIAVSKGIVVVAGNKSLTAIRSSDDTILWQKKTTFEMNNLLTTSDGHTYYQGIGNIKQQTKDNTNTGTYDESYYSLNMQTGAIEWKWTRSVSMNGGIGSPGEGVVVNGKLCFFYVSDFTNAGKEGMFVIDNGKKSFYPLPADWQK